MKIVHRYLLREVTVNAGLALLLFTFVIFMKNIGQLLEVTVRANSASVLLVFLYAVPAALVFTLPMALLAGVLIGLGRLGVDSELTALRAAGVSGRQLLSPLLSLTAVTLAISCLMTLWLAPASLRRLTALEGRMANTQAVYEIEPRVFLESIPNLVIYVGDTLNGGKNWRQVFIADTRDSTQPRLILARTGQVIANGRQGVQLHLENGLMYETDPGHPESSLTSAFDVTDIPIALPPAPPTSSLSALSWNALQRRSLYAADWRAARIELHRRLALSLACLALALLAAPLGLAAGSGRSGKSGGFVLTLMLVCGYYITLVLGLGLAKTGKVPPWAGTWAANVLFLAAGLWVLYRMDGVRGKWASNFNLAERLKAIKLGRFGRRRRLAEGEGVAAPEAARRWSPSLIEGYVAKEFLGHTFMLLGSFMVLILVFTFFELSADILRTHTGFGVAFQYLIFLSPEMLYILAPVAILVGVLVTFGLMSKSNEVTALKASGVSAYRLIVPVLFAAVAMSAMQFTLDATWLPDFNRRSADLYARIKNRPAQTFQRPGDRWLVGQHDDIYFFRFFDSASRQIDQVSVFEIDPKSFQLTRQIFARQARWEDNVKTWVFTQGWQRELEGPRQLKYQEYQLANFGELREEPSYFSTEARQGSEMTYLELRSYIAGLQAGGYDVARLSVQLAKKLAYPAITIVMALLAFPFALTVGRKGTVAGLALAVGVGISYWVLAGILEALGNLGQLPPLLAAWAPDVFFMIASAYLLLRVPT